MRRGARRVLPFADAFHAVGRQSLAHEREQLFARREAGLVPFEVIADLAVGCDDLPDALRRDVRALTVSWVGFSALMSMPSSATNFTRPSQPDR